MGEDTSLILIINIGRNHVHPSNTLEAHHKENSVASQQPETLKRIRNSCNIKQQNKEHVMTNGCCR